jgi:ATP-binding cassette, subfamily B, bacterial
VSRPQSFGEMVPTWRRVVRHVRPSLREERGLIALTLAALLAETALRVLEPWPLKLVFDTVLVPGRHRQEWSWLAGRDSSTIIIGAAAAVLVLTALRAGTAYTSTVSGALVGNRVVSRLRDELYTHLQRLPLKFHARSRAGDLTVRLIGDVGVMKDVAVTAMLPLIANVMILVGMAAVMLWFNWQLGLVALALLPLVALSTRRLGRRIHNTAREQRRHEGDLAARAAESMVAVRVVRALSLEEEFGRTFARGSSRSLREGVRGKRLEARLERTADMLVAAVTAAVLAMGAHLVLTGQLTPGDLLVFLAYLKTGVRPVNDFAKYSGRLAKAAAAADRVLDLLDEAPESDARPGAIEAPPLKGAVRIDHASFEYELGRPALEDVVLNVPAGARVFVIGPSGSGKSTLVSLLMRLYSPTRGAISIDGHDLRDLTAASLRRQFSVVLQDTLLFAGTVRDNIVCGLDHVPDEDVLAAARLADADGFITRLPDGYGTFVGERGATFSAGQRQRIAIARAAIRGAPIVVLDEPTTGLDDASKSQVLEALDRLARGRTTFFITHDVILSAGRADLVVWLEHGRVIECGTPETLLAAGGRYARALSDASSLRLDGGQRALAK